MTRLFLVLSLPVILAAQPQGHPGIDDALTFSVPSSPRISPEGTRVVYQLSRTNWEDNAFESDLWLCDVAAPGHPRLMTAGPGWNGEPRWAPDGRQIAFVSDRSGRREIFVISPSGGEARKLTSAENGVNSFRWAPDGKAIAFTSDDDGDSHKKRNERYGDFEIVNSEAPSASLWLVRIPDRPEAAPGAPELLTKGRKELIGAFAWSPDGSKIAFESDGIHILDVAAATTTTIASGSGPYRNPVWSPDGRYVAFETAGGDPGFYYSNWFIARAPAQGGPTEPLTKG
ncbi:MAG TPA: hypothetical protein VHB50_01865, partial [Bryobacteraceae bacterium]|nr:hypothetical protein [Bryobacteraceae bacterium]